MTIADCEAMPIPDIVALFELTGSTITEEEIKANIAAGAPVNANGTLDLLKYGAWLVEDATQKRS